MYVKNKYSGRLGKVKGRFSADGQSSYKVLYNGDKSISFHSKGDLVFMSKTVDKCSCGLLKYSHDEKCEDCKDKHSAMCGCVQCMPEMHERLGKLFPDDIKLEAIVTSGRCETHNEFYTVPGGSCSKCDDNIRDLISKEVANPTTGSKRYNTGKPQTSEIDPEFIIGIAKVLTKSREKYERANWALGNNWSVPYESMMRHLMAFQAGEENDAESGQHHLLHAATNIMFLYYYSQQFPEFDDRVFKKKGKK